MLLGIWHNIEDLENKINLEELRVILDAARERDYRNQRFMASIQGIDIEAGAKEEAQERLDKIKARANAALSGKTEEELEWAELGMRFEIEE